jgi:hypothetical protein
MTTAVGGCHFYIFSQVRFRHFRPTVLFQKGITELGLPNVGLQ